MKPEIYWDMWQSCQVDISKIDHIARVAASIISNWPRYTEVKNQTGVPEHVTGVIHYRESDFDFRTYLANGDPLFSHTGYPLQTVHVPKGLGPVKDWSQGAAVSFRHEEYDRVKDWSIGNALMWLEIWNGSGYARHGINSPYLWSGTNEYSRGKYVADGQFDPWAVDQQLGCVPILKALAKHVDVLERAP